MLPVRALPAAAVLLGVAMLLPAASASADVYTYTDRNGVVHFTNMAPRGDGRWRMLFRTNDRNGPLRAGAGRDVRPARDRSPLRYTRYDPYIREAAALYHIPDALIRAVIRVESDYDPNVVSWAGAQGLMQLMPGTATRMAVTNPFDPRQSVLGGTRYLRILANLFNGDIVLTLAAYNAGEGTVMRSGGMPRNPQIHTYVRNVLRHFYAFRLVEMATARSVQEAVDQSQRLEPATPGAQPPATATPATASPSSAARTPTGAAGALPAPAPSTPRTASPQTQRPATSPPPTSTR